MRDLVPGKHYIPIRHDLSDLIQKATFVTNPKNANYVHRIQQQANEYCSKHMTWTKLAEDVLDVFEDYLRYLELHDPQWMKRWKEIKHKDFMNPNKPQKKNGRGAGFDMRPITKRLQDIYKVNK